MHHSDINCYYKNESFAFGALGLKQCNNNYLLNSMCINKTSNWKFYSISQMFDTEVSTALYRHPSISLISIIVPTLVDEQTEPFKG